MHRQAAQRQAVQQKLSHLWTHCGPSSPVPYKVTAFGMGELEVLVWCDEPEEGAPEGRALGAFRRQ